MKSKELQNTGFPRILQFLQATIPHLSTTFYYPGLKLKHSHSVSG